MLNFFPNKLFVAHQGQGGSGRGLSPRLWTNVLGSAMPSNGLDNCYALADDFLSFGPSRAVDNNVGYYASEAGLYKSYEDTGDSIAQLATAVGGVIKLATDDTDNDEVWLQSGAGAGVLGVISDTAGADKRLIFECRWIPDTVTDQGVFVGLSEEGLAAANTVADNTGELADKDFIGFHTLAASPTRLDFVYRKAGGAKQILIQGVATLVAGTPIKTGFIYDPAAPASEKIRVYVDNVEHATKGTAAQIAAATFPDGEELAFLAGLKSGSSAIKSISLDWWSFYQDA